MDILLEDIRDAESVVFNYRKEVSEMEAKLRAQQNLYQAARNDRTILNKSLTEAQVRTEEELTLQSSHVHVSNNFTLISF